MDEVFDLSRFDEYREDNRREVKAAEGGLPQNLWESYSSMANTYGGVIICGVKERSNGSWFTTGMKDASKLKRNFWNQINDSKKVSINLLHESDVKDYLIGDDVVLVIKVPVADREQKPVYINGDRFKGTYKRNNEGDYHCTELEVNAMIRDQPRRTIDGKILPGMDLSVLNADTIKTYRMIMESKKPGHVFLTYDENRFLEAIGAAKYTEDRTLHPTCAGLLMFGVEYKILYEYALYFLDYREHMLPDVRWTDRIQSQSGDWSGNVFDFFYRVSAKLTVDLKKPFQLVDMIRIDETPLHDAVREALVNCLTNADYFEPRGVVIEKYPDRIVLKNPGTCILPKAQMLRGGESEPRNANMLKMFNLIGYGERSGSGVPDIFDAWNQAGYLEPVIDEQFGNGEPSRTVLTLPLIEKDHHTDQHPGGNLGGDSGDESSSVDWEARKAGVIKLLKENPSISTVGIVSALGLTRRQVEKTLNALKNEGKISREGPAHGGRWDVHD